VNITPESPVRFRSGVAGVECDILVTWYIPAVPAQGMTGPMEDAIPMETSEFEFECIGSHKQETDWLNGQITRADEDRIFDEFEAYLLAQKHNKEF
jgi:hypothetical protein